MIETYRGYVNTWECDEIGHLNVQFYLAKLDEALMHLRIRLGLTPERVAREGWTVRSAGDHIRYVAERHVGDTILWVSGVLDAGPHGIRVYSEMRDALTGAVAAGVTTDWRGIRLADDAPAPIAPDVVAAAEALAAERPRIGAPLGIAEDTALPDLSYDEVMSRQLEPTYRGAVQPWHCGPEGWNAVRHYIGRLSDGAGHMFAMVGFTAEKLRDERRGAVALEQQCRYGRPLRPGEAVTTHSALIGLGSKTLEFGHWMFELAGGACVAKFRVIAIAFDLERRRAVQLPEADREQAEALLVRLS